MLEKLVLLREHPGLRAAALSWAQGWGTLAGSLSEVYRNAKDSGVSCADFLRRFSVSHEMPYIDPDSINPIPYHVSLSALENTLIVEPEEVREDVPALRLTVVLDTSGSCSGAIMQEFLEYTLFPNIEAFAGRSGISNETEQYRA